MNLLNICVNLSLSSCDEPLALPSGCAKGVIASAGPIAATIPTAG